MAGFTDYLEGKLVDVTLRGQVFTAPATVYCAVHTAAPTDAAPSTGEVSGGAYARVAIVATTSAWSAHGAAGPSSNSAVITFPTATANWGTITHGSLWDAASAGNCLYWGALTANKVVNNGDTFSFAASAFAITLD